MADRAYGCPSYRWLLAVKQIVLAHYGGKVAKAAGS